MQKCCHRISGFRRTNSREAPGARGNRWFTCLCVLHWRATWYFTFSHCIGGFKLHLCIPSSLIQQRTICCRFARTILTTLCFRQGFSLVWEPHSRTVKLLVNGNCGLHKHLQSRSIFLNSNKWCFAFTLFCPHRSVPWPSWESHDNGPWWQWQENEMLPSDAVSLTIARHAWEFYFLHHSL